MRKFANLAPSANSASCIDGMNVSEFFEKFDLFADAPNAMAKMRELVLDQAIQGKLVAQDGGDEPASAQLERIATRKLEAARIVRTKGRKASTSVAVEPATHVPLGWARASLSELVTVLNGRVYSKDGLLSSGTPVLRVGNLFRFRLIGCPTPGLIPPDHCSARRDRLAER